MRFSEIANNEVVPDEFLRIRHACHDLGADEEMTALVLASHRYNRALLDVMVADGSDLLGYVRHKLAIWETILTDSPNEASLQACQNDHNRSAALPISGVAGH